MLHRFDPRRSLRVRVSLTIGVICFVFFAGFAWGIGYTLRAQSERATKQEFESLSLRIISVLDESMYTRYRNIENVANLYSIRSPLFNSEEKQRVLENIQDADPGFSWIGLTDASGLVQASTGGLLLGMDVSARPWFEGAHTTPYFGDVHPALLLQELLQPSDDTPLRFVDIAVPVHTIQGNFGGVLSAHLEWAWAEHMLNSILLPFNHRSGLHAFIVATDGTVLVSSVPDFDATQFSQLLSAFSVNHLNVARASDIIGTSDGEDMLMGVAQSQGYREYPGLGWRVVVLQPAANAFALAREIERTIFLWGAGLSVLLIVTIWTISGHIVRPLSSIANAANRIMHTQNGGSIPIIGGNDEISSLSRSLHILFERLRAGMERLEALHAIDRSIMQADDLEVTLAIIVRETQQKLKADAVNILLVDETSKQLYFASGIGFNTNTFQQAIIPIDAELPGQVAKSRRPITIFDIQATPGLMRLEGFQREGFVSYAATPLITQQRLIGVLEIHSRHALAPDDAWSDFLASLGLQTAIAIQHAYLFTETKTLLAKTTQQANELGHILESVPIGLLLLDREYNLLQQNATAIEHLHQLATYDENGKLQRFGDLSLDELLTSADSGEPQHEVIAPDTKRIYTFITYKLATPTSGSKWLIVIDDVTVERQRRQYLQRQERLATVGQLSAGIAHDFNNILTPIYIYGHMLVQHSDDMRMRNGLQSILQAADRAKQLIAQILTFSRGRPDVQWEPIYLQPIIGEVLSLLDAVLPASIVIQQHVLPQVPAIRGDGSQIHQVLMNLCTNAYQAMPEGGTLTVSLETVPADMIAQSLEGASLSRSDIGQTPFAHLAIADTGMGMDPATLERIFEPFFTTKIPGQGTGMGLAMVHDVIKEHAGYISVESVQHKGTVFHIYLPVATDASAEVQAHEGDAIRGNGEHLLIVDDEETILAALKQALTASGYRVTVENHSLDALEIVRQRGNSFDLLITDLNMPYLTGDELINSVRDIRSDLPFILMSGSSKLLTHNRIVNTPAADIVTKPFTIQELVQTIHSVLNTKVGHDGEEPR